MPPRRSAWPLLWAALGCFPSDDLSRYSAEWSEFAPSGGGAPAGDPSGSAGALGDDPDLPPGAAGTGSGVAGSSVGGAEGVVGGGMLPLAGAAGSGLEPGASEADAGIGSGSGGTLGETDPELPADACGDDLLGADETRCYRVSLVVATWQVAQADCVAWQGSLVQVETPEEDTFLDGIVTASIWIGGSDTVFDNIFTWVDGSPITFGNWGLNQPDRFPGPDCVEKRGIGFGRQWFDQPCNNERAYVCEKAATASN